LLVGGLIFSQVPLFKGIAEDLHKSAGRFSVDKPKRTIYHDNSSFHDIGVSTIIEKMMDCSTAVAMWELQKTLKETELRKSEKPRWFIHEESSNHRRAISAWLLEAIRFSIGFLGLISMYCMANKIAIFGYDLETPFPPFLLYSVVIAVLSCFSVMLLNFAISRYVGKAIDYRHLFWVIPMGVLNVVWFLPSAMFLFVLLYIVIAFASLNEAGLIILLVIAIGSGVAMELYRWKYMDAPPCEGGESISEFVREEEVVVAGGEIDSLVVNANDLDIAIDEGEGIELEKMGRGMDEVVSSELAKESKQTEVRL